MAIGKILPMASSVFLFPEINVLIYFGNSVIVPGGTAILNEKTPPSNEDGVTLRYY
jgi:hypothetical protein